MHEVIWVLIWSCYMDPFLAEKLISTLYLHQDLGQILIPHLSVSNEPTLTKVIEYVKLEGTHMDYQVQLPNPHRTI